MEKIERYDISKLDIFEFATKRQELCNFHSLLVFLYNKKLEDTPDVVFKYSEISWMDKRIVKRLVESLKELGLITIVSTPQHHSKNQNSPFRIKLKSNEEINTSLNGGKKLCFETFNAKTFCKKDFADALGCSRIRENFLLASVGSWVKNINREVWDLSEFLILAKIISYFNCDDKIKTYTLQKYMAQKSPFIIGKVRFLYTKIPLSKKDVISAQFQNTLKELKIKNDGSFEDMVKKYQKKIKEPSMVPLSSTN